MEDVKIVRCNFEDPVHTHSLIALMNAYISDKMGGGEPLTGQKALDLIDGLKQLPTSLVLFAVVDDKFVGLCNSFINFATFTVKKFINVHDIVVLDEYRGTGIGRKLLSAVVNFAREINCSKVTLEVREDNVVAQSLYTSVGFEENRPKMYFWTKML